MSSFVSTDLSVLVGIGTRGSMSCRLGARLRIITVFLGVAVCVAFSAPGLFAQGEQVFQGQITQCSCGGQDDHAAAPNNGGTATRCPPPCANGDIKYVLGNIKNRVAYQFDKQDFPRIFAAQNVLVVGTLDNATGTIHVNNIVQDLPPKIKRAKTISIICDACPRGMAKAKGAAFQELTAWKRFTIVPDPKKADLVFLFSANRYLGDLVTRDGPDTRVVHVESTYMNVIDPLTGESLWGDSERVGSWFTASATRDLIDELREWMEADASLGERKLFLKRHWIIKAAVNTGK